jgi:hypothetical protein
MKTITTITAHIYDGSKIARPERNYAFIRKSSATKPTFAGAARMVAADAGCRPSDVSVSRIEHVCYDA